jgi:asparagine synthase (glutamine-hydrolysing)
MDKLALGLKKIHGDSFDNILQDASMALKGHIKCFSYWYADYGYPVNWHLNPVKETCWPSGEHWSIALNKETDCGDCKLTWEINRFPHVYSWMRAYAVTEDSCWVKAFTAQIKEWENSNLYRGGLNWNSGQELAIRCLTWIAALYVFVDDPAFREEDFERILRLIYLHGEHISANIEYARMAVHNNHLIAEALALYVIGSYFPWLKDSRKWKRKGRSLLEKDCLLQFYKDGGYCQCSHNYHRLALHYYLWACRTGECLGEPLGPEVYNALMLSGRYFSAFMNGKDGRLPNWGANDGALFCPWTSCDYADFRPIISSLRYITLGKKAFPEGPWEEELLWMFGPEALEAEIMPYRHGGVTDFPNSGLQVLRRGQDDFAVLRCGSVVDRFGQADQLHSDIWWKGLNVAQDGGSYLYNDELQFHYYFMNTFSHNTISVDGAGQMLLYRRFKWLDRVNARQTGTYISGKLMGVSGEHYGYCRLPGEVLHKRFMWTPDDGIYVIADSIFQLSGTVEHVLRLQWLLGPWDWEFNKKEHWFLVGQNTPMGVYRLCQLVYSQKTGLSADATISLVRGENGSNPRGWISRYYGHREPALSVELTCVTADPVLFVSVFAPGDVDWEAVYKKGGLLFNSGGKTKFAGLRGYQPAL